MSDLGSSKSLDLSAKPAGSLESTPVARCVHSLPAMWIVALVALAAVVLGGCPPPPLSLDEPDATENYPPSITSLRRDDGGEFMIGTPNIIIRTETTMTLTLFDADLGDTLYVRGFFNYDETDPSSARALCAIGPSVDPMASRSVTCALGAFCRDGDVTGMLDVVASDREPDDGGQLSIRTYLGVTPPGLQDRRTYPIRCQEPAPV